MKASRFALVAIFLVIVVGISGVTYAGSSTPMIDKVTSDNYLERAAYRALQGVVNAVLSWTQLYVEPVNSVRYEDQDAVDGIFEGLSKTLYYALVGAWDVATFWFPGEGGKEIAVKDCVTTTFKRG